MQKPTHPWVGFCAGCNRAIPREYGVHSVFVNPPQLLPSNDIYHCGESGFGNCSQDYTGALGDREASIAASLEVCGAHGVYGEHRVHGKV